MSDDLVKRLREPANWMREARGDWKGAELSYDSAPKEAAARIEALEAVVKEARWLLERTPVGKLKVAAGVADKLACLDAQKDKSDD